MDLALPRVTRSPYLVELIADAERLAAVVSGAPETARQAAREPLQSTSALHTCQLDGSPMTHVPDLGVTIADLDPAALRDGTGLSLPAATDDGEAAEPAGWLELLARHGRDLEDVPDEAITTLEYVGARAALASDDLVEGLFADTERTLATLHTRLTRGLVEPEAAGALRATDQAVHDGASGRILYFPVEPRDVPARLAVLGGWLQTAGAREHALVVSGVVHVTLLDVHPFEAANGRLARAAARLLLRARGLDPDALAQVDAALARDPLGYQEEVARTRRRRDTTVWLERWGEAVVAGLREAARHLDALDTAVPDRAEAFVSGRAPTADGGAGTTFTVADYRADVGVGPEEARADLAALLDAGRVARAPGARGLRFDTVRG
ncbi:MAG: Fic family protein [Actinomycetes bacterium]